MINSKEKNIQNMYIRLKLNKQNGLFKYRFNNNGMIVNKFIKWQ